MNHAHGAAGADVPETWDASAVTNDESTYRILVVHPGAELYGSDRVLIDAVIGFAERGSDVRVVLPEDGPLRERIATHGVDVRVVPTLVLRKALMKPRGWPALIAGLTAGQARAMREVRDFEPDVVYVSTITQPLWPWVARRAKARSIVHVHEAETSASQLVSRVLYAPVRLATNVVLNSAFSRDVMLRAAPGLADRSEIVWNPVPGPSDPTPPRADLEGRIRLGYVGRLSPRKGVDVAVKAVAQLVAEGRDATLDLIGAVFAGYEWYEQELRDLVAAHGLGDRVRFLGFQSSVWDALAEVDVVVVPSRLDEPFGNTAVEAVLARRPVIVSDTSGLREASAGVPTAIRVRPDDPSALAGAVARIADTWDAVVGQVPVAEALVRERHDVEAFRARLDAIARSVAAG